MAKTVSTKKKSSKKKYFIAAAIAISGALIYIALPKGESLQDAEKSSVIGVAPHDFHGILPEGTGGDPDLSRLKNRWVAPAVVSQMSVSQVIALEHDILDQMGKARRN